MKKNEILTQIKEQFSEIGKIYFEEHKDDANVDSKYENTFAKINAFHTELQKIEDEELKAQGLKRCPDCQNKVVLESRFCNMCGHKFADVDAPEKVEIVEKKINKCWNCGTELEDDAVFCPNCGKKN